MQLASTPFQYAGKGAPGLPAWPVFRLARTLVQQVRSAVPTLSVLPTLKALVQQITTVVPTPVATRILPLSTTGLFKVAPSIKAVVFASKEPTTTASAVLGKPCQMASKPVLIAVVPVVLIAP